MPLYLREHFCRFNTYFFFLPIYAVCLCCKGEIRQLKMDLMNVAKAFWGHPSSVWMAMTNPCDKSHLKHVHHKTKTVQSLSQLSLPVYHHLQLQQEWLSPLSWTERGVMIKGVPKTCGHLNFKMLTKVPRCFLKRNRDHKILCSHSSTL